MEVVFLVLSFSASSLALQNKYTSRINHLDESGHYVDDSSGQYIPDDSGKYIPDHSGEYRPDGLGLYSGDLSGLYTGDGSGLYKGINDLYKHDKDGRDGNGNKNNNYQDLQNQANLLGFASSINNKFATFNPHNRHSDKVSIRKDDSNFENAASATNQVLTKQLVYKTQSPQFSKNNYDQSRYADGRWRIIRQDGQTDTDGYHWLYETENGITAEESGKVHNKGTDAEVMKAKGFFQYTGPDNVVISTGYTADERGFIPVGNHLPTPPPTPVAILRALDYLKSIGKL